MSMYNYPTDKTVEDLRARYPEGTRVRLVKMNDPYATLLPGDLGTVITVDDVGTVHVEWDKGSSLGAVYGEDVIERV